MLTFQPGDLPQRVGPLVPRLLMNMTGVVKDSGLRIGQVGFKYAFTSTCALIFNDASGWGISSRKLPRRSHAGQARRNHSALLQLDWSQDVVHGDSSQVENERKTSF